MIGIYVASADGKSEIFVEECMNIAQLIIKKGEKVIFFLKSDMYADILKKDGYSYIVHEDDYEISGIVKVIMEKNISSLIVDSSAISPDDIASLSVYTKIVAFDEDKLPQNLVCVINYNPFVGWNEYILNYCNGDTKLLLGGDFAPINSLFSDVNPKKKEFNSKIEDILVYTGRYDRYGVGYSLLSKMSRISEFNGYRIHTIIGNGYNSPDIYYKLQEESDGKIIVHEMTENIADIISACDIAVSSGGLHLMEVAACGIPSVLYATVENQSEQIRQMIVKEYAIGVGDIWISIELKMNSIIENVLNLIKDTEKRKKLSNNIKTLTDGKGTERIVNVILN